MVKHWAGAVLGVIGGGLLLSTATSGTAKADQPATKTTQIRSPVSRPLYVTQAPIIMLKDVESGAVLFSRGQDRRFAPASMTKTMTAYVVLDLIEKGELKLTDRFLMTEEIWRVWQRRRGNSTMFLRPGERVTVDKLLMGMLAVSGNDAAMLLAVGIDGSEEKFTERMNQVAKRIGMANSNFGTASGWMDGGKTMVTAGDMILLADRLIREHPKSYAKYFSQPSFTHGTSPDGKPITQRNRNPLLGRIEGADGLKTGYTAEAGFCLLGSAKRDGRRLIMVVAGMESAAARRSEAERLMQWGFGAWEGRVIAAERSPLLALNVDEGDKPTVIATNSLPLLMTVPRGYKGGYEARISGQSPLTAPIRKGDVVAHVTVTPAGLPPQITPLIASETVEQGGAWDRVRTGLFRMTGI